MKISSYNPPPTPTCLAWSLSANNANVHCRSFLSKLMSYSHFTYLICLINSHTPSRQSFQKVGWSFTMFDFILAYCFVIFKPETILIAFIGEHALRREVVVEKYGFIEGGWWRTRSIMILFGCTMWLNIMKGWEDFSDHITFRVGDGRSSFWNHKWLSGVGRMHWGFHSLMCSEFRTKVICHQIQRVQEEEVLLGSKV